MAIPCAVGYLSEPNLEDPQFTQLKTVFDKDDAEHILQAIKAECDYFLAVDYSTILNRVETNIKILLDISPNTQLVDPIELLKQVTSV